VGVASDTMTATDAIKIVPIAKMLAFKTLSFVMMFSSTGSVAPRCRLGMPRSGLFV
jgi:hypothetical protein